MMPDPEFHGAPECRRQISSGNEATKNKETLSIHHSINVFHLGRDTSERDGVLTQTTYIGTSTV
jgi:hypothetical protein